MEYSIGVCLGASTVSLVRISTNNGLTIENVIVKAHNGDPKSVFLDFLSQFDLNTHSVVVTGRKFRHLTAFTNISEPTATEFALTYLNKGENKYSAVASLGGETFLLYLLDNNGRISDVVSKNQCASGTGEFYLQQIKRMDLNLDDSMKIAENANPFKVTGRCSVFCKSDCTHALNKGVAKSEVTAGLSSMIADKINELLSKNVKGKALLIGGVTQNTVVLDYLRKNFPNCDVDENATHFEALGAAVYGLEKQVKIINSIENIFIGIESSFTFHKPLTQFKDKVIFKSLEKRKAVEFEKCILGLDVGSTTTKAVIISLENKDLVASSYIYTNGDPIRASRDCYDSLVKQVPDNIQIVGLGTTGSGRQIAGIHSLTESVINEIIAHATAAVYFDAEVDTIFEIGGQDAKYTYIVNKVPADYAMNEACSAGTGSFIEESAWESLRIKVQDIETIAMKAQNPPNFSDQCAAFIGSDIKTALQENLSKEDITAGLVYSICMNYVNRVKGNRTVGKKIFMQGGVCYNKAIPIAMAALTGIDIIVPPEPGLMGAYGVALRVIEMLQSGMIEENDFDLITLANREVTYKKPFVCLGGKEECDRKCSISIIEIENKKFTFGGACNKYYNIKNQHSFPTDKYDFVKKRHFLTFNEFAPKYELPENAPVVGINASFHTHTIFPLYYNFFSKLGFKVILPNHSDEEGMDRETSSMCYPAQISLGMFHNLIHKKPDYFFVPFILEMYVDAKEDEVQRLDFNCTCVFVSGEPFYLKQSFKDFDFTGKWIAPKLNFSNGWHTEEQKFIETAIQMGVKDKKKATEAFKFALKMQDDYQQALYKLGDEALQLLKENPDEFAIVVVGRPYNSFNDTANKGIPQKFASRGIYVLPYDIFDFRNEGIEDFMYWEGGKKILKVSKLIKEHPQLFATYISNYSCGPDSMILTTFRSIMGTKPSLTLELDSHTADAGINTRIDAAVDIIKNYIHLKDSIYDTDYGDFKLADIESKDGKNHFISSSGEKILMNDPRVQILIPSMGDLGAKFFAAALRSLGFKADALPVSTSETLKYGRAYASGKECLPLILLSGALLEYIDKQWDGKSYIAFFIVQGAGNCRLGQYPVFIRNVIKQKKLKNVAQMVLMNEDGFAGFGSDFAMRGIQAIIASDVLDDVRSAILANSKNHIDGMKYFDKEIDELSNKFIKHPEKFYKHLLEFSLNLKNNIPVQTAIEQSKYIALLGEIYVRRDGFSHKWLNKEFAKKGFVVKTAHINEWIQYVDFLIKIDLLEPDKSIKKKIEQEIRYLFMRKAEKKIKKILSKSGFYEYELTNIKYILEHSKHILPLDFKGEPGLVLGTALSESLEKYAGIINLGPFGCMPTRFTEAVGAGEMTVKHKIELKQLHNSKYKLSEVFNGNMNIPFLTIEVDGNTFPQVIEAKLETFTLQAERTAQLMKLSKNGFSKK